MNRRQFLGLTAGLAALAGLAGSVPVAATAADIYPTAWCPFEGGPGRTFWGDIFAMAHNLRDGKSFAVTTPTETCDVVIFGAGVSGLTAAYLLRDKDVVILEKDPQPNGTAKAAYWEGVHYPLGAIYYTEPEGELTAFYKEIGIPIMEIPRPVDVLLAGGQRLEEFFGPGIRNGPWSPQVRRSFERAWKHFNDFNKDPDAPQIPPEDSHPKAFELDKVTFAEYCKDYEEPVRQLLDEYTRSCWGVTADKVSAFGVINFLASEFVPTYTSPDGNGIFAETLASKVKNRIRTDCFVSRVTQQNGVIEVTYQQNGQPRALRAKSAIVATPKHIASYYLQGLEPERIDAIRKMRYGSYMSGSIYVDHPIEWQGWDFWSMGRWYSDILVTDWILKAQGKTLDPQRKTVLVASLPMGESEGRAELLAGNYDAFDARLRADLAKDFPGIERHIVGTRFARYGHGMALCYPGFMSNIAPVLRKPWGRVAFAHCDITGMPCVEAAVHTAMRAARLVKNDFKEA
jgi:monoamine oxidase